MIPEIGDEYTMLQSRMNLLVNSAEELAALNDNIYQSAVRAKTPYQDLANIVTNIGTNASGAFNDDMSQIVAFGELLSKTFTIAGADANTVASTMYNLTQSLSTGKLMTQDYKIIKQNAPTMIKYLQEYFNTNSAGLDEMVTNGEVTAESIKLAMFNAVDDINNKFNGMDTTFGQAVTNMKNRLYYAFAPVISTLSSALASVISFVMDNLNYILPTLVMVGTIIIGMIVVGLWSMIAPIMTAVIGFITMNAPILMVIATVGALLGLLVAFPEVLGTIIGGVMAVGTAFGNVIKWVANQWIALINLIISALNKIPGVNIQAMSSFDYGSIAESFEGGQEIGQDLADKVNNFKDKLTGMGDFANAPGFDMSSLGDMSANIGDIKKDTGKMNKTGVKVNNDVKIDDENLKLLLDVATKKFTINYKQLTPTITANFGDVRETADVDDILGAIEDRTLKLMNSSLVY